MILDTVESGASFAGKAILAGAEFNEIANILEITSSYVYQLVGKYAQEDYTMFRDIAKKNRNKPMYTPIYLSSPRNLFSSELEKNVVNAKGEVDYVLFGKYFGRLIEKGHCAESIASLYGITTEFLWKWIRHTHIMPATEALFIKSVKNREAMRNGIYPSQIHLTNVREKGSNEYKINMLKAMRGCDRYLFIHNLVISSGMTITEIAEELGISRSNLYTSCKKCLGKDYVAFIQKNRENEKQKRQERKKKEVEIQQAFAKMAPSKVMYILDAEALIYDLSITKKLLKKGSVAIAQNIYGELLDIMKKGGLKGKLANRIGCKLITLEDEGTISILGDTEIEESFFTKWRSKLNERDICLLIAAKNPDIIIVSGKTALVNAAKKEKVKCTHIQNVHFIP